MEKTCVSHKPGDIVSLAGIDFVVLDNNMASSADEPETLLILAVESQGDCTFGSSNNYAESNLREKVNEWLYRLTETLDEQYGYERPNIKNRTISLLTLDGHGDYGSIEVAAAPLTLDEARKYAKLIPECDDAAWLATGWGGPEHNGSTLALFVSTVGGWDYNRCSSTWGIRPALVISSELLASESDDLDLSSIPDDVLLRELQRRLEAEA